MTQTITVRKGDRILKVDPGDLPAYLEQGFVVVPVVPKPAVAAPPTAPRRTERVVTMRRDGRTLVVAAHEVEQHLEAGYALVEPEPVAAVVTDGAPRRRRMKLEEAPESLLGSSVQPATFTLEDGRIVQLGEAVAEAHLRSGLTAAEWNALPAEEIEALIAEVVEELPLAAATDSGDVDASDDAPAGDTEDEASTESTADDQSTDAEEPEADPASDPAAKKTARRRTRG